LKILLVYPEADRAVSAYNDYGAIGEPIALEYLAGAARDGGHEAHILDLRFHADELDSTLESLQPDIVGVTGYSQHVLRMLEVCRRSRSLCPDATTICGGHHATLEPVDFCEDEVDFIVQGEGTVPFGRLLRELSGQADLAEIPGLWRRESPFEGVKALRAFRLDADTAAFKIDEVAKPDRTLVDRDREHYFISGLSNIALLRTTVGCPYRCSFCALWVAMDGRYYIHEVARTIEELKEISAPSIMLVDDEPFINRRHMNELAEAIEQAGIEKKYYAYCRTDSFIRERDLLLRWKALGLTKLFIGVESIFDAELDRYNKRQKRKQILETFERAREIGIGLHTNFIVHPSYTAEQIDELKSFIRDAGLELPTFTVWTPIPGTVPDFDNVVRRQPNGRPDWRYFDLQNAVTETRLPAGEFRKRYMGLYHEFQDLYEGNMNPYLASVIAEEMAARARGAGRVGAGALGRS
jgi:radical SAM superfamily enzyme YgiQ (UPF0313 family)